MQWQLALRKVYMTSARFTYCYMIHKLTLCRSREICMFPRGGVCTSVGPWVRFFRTLVPLHEAIEPRVRPRGGMYESRRLPRGVMNMQIQAPPPRAGKYANPGGSPKGREICKSRRLPQGICKPRQLPTRNTQGI